MRSIIASIQRGIAVSALGCLLPALFAGCADVSRAQTVTGDWGLDVSMVAEQQRAPKSVIWFSLINRSTADRLVCTRNSAWFYRKQMKGQIAPGVRGACETVDEYQLLRPKNSLTVALTTSESIPADVEEFGIHFFEMAWPTLDKPELREAIWRGNVATALTNGRNLIR